MSAVSAGSLAISPRYSINLVLTYISRTVMKEEKVVSNRAGVVGQHTQPYCVSNLQQGSSCMSILRPGKEGVNGLQ